MFYKIVTRKSDVLTVRTVFCALGSTYCTLSVRSSGNTIYNKNGVVIIDKMNDKKKR